MKSRSLAAIIAVLLAYPAHAAPQFYPAPSGGSLTVGTAPVQGTCTNGYLLFNNAGVLGCQAASAASLSIGGSITGGTSGYIEYDNAGVLGELATTGSGNVVRATGPTLTGGTVTLGDTSAGGAITTAVPMLNAAQRYNNSGTTFVLSNFDFYDQASSLNSLITQWQTSAATAGGIDKGGVLFIGPAPIGGPQTGELDPGIVINRGINANFFIGGSASGVDAHGFADISSMTTRAGSPSYNSFDAHFAINGTLSYSHYAGFQSRPSFGTSGTVGIDYDVYAGPSISAGTLTTRYGLYVANTTITGGAIGSQYGLYIEAMTGATTNYALYSAGTALSYLAGSIQTASNMIASVGRFESDKTSIGYLNDGVAVYNGGSFGFTSGSTGLLGSVDTAFWRDGAGIMALRNGAAAQIFRAYNTYTNSTNYERGVFDWQTAANVLTIGAQAAGTGVLRGVNIIGASLSINGTAGVTCSGTPTSSFAATNGIVTHC